MGYVILISILIAIWDYSRKKKKSASETEKP